MWFTLYRHVTFAVTPLQILYSKTVKARLDSSFLAVQSVFSFGLYKFSAEPPETNLTYIF